jgi:RsiW-degrading membrane proteinase PrsW (M82 family)
MKEQFYIQYQKGIRLEKVFLEKDQKITIGRDPASKITIFDGGSNKVSRNHATIYLDKNDTILFQDHSTNGSYINNEKIHQGQIFLQTGDRIKCSKQGQELIVLALEQKQAPDKAVNDYSTNIGFTKLMPLAKIGFAREVVQKPLFLPALLTVITAMGLFISINADSYSGYLWLVAIYLSIMLLLSVRAVSDNDMPIWLLTIPAVSTAVLLFFGLPFFLLGLIFRPPIIVQWMASEIFIERFLGYYIGAGMMEELFKLIPLYLVYFMRKRLLPLKIQGLAEKGMTPGLAMLIASSSAIGFIIVETMFDYVPEFESMIGDFSGLILLIPRFISGLAGHIAFSGLFAYYVGLSLYYQKRFGYFFIIGWFMSSLFHGLWNSVNIYIFSILVALSTFMYFISLVVKSQKSYSFEKEGFHNV